MLSKAWALISDLGVKNLSLVAYCLVMVGMGYLFVRPKQESKKFGWLSLIFGLIIGIYWLLRPLKDSIFISVVGGNYIPYAKYLSLVVVFPLVIIYSKLVDMFPRQKMFYALCTIYGVAALIFAAIMYTPSLGLANTIASYDRWWGWAWYVYVESFGSLIVALFWAFAADTTSPESAAKGYPLVAFGGQLGNIVGPFLLMLIGHLTHMEVGPEGELSKAAAQNSATVMVGMVIFAGVAVLSIIGLIYHFMKVIPKDQLAGFHAKNEHKDEEPGFFEGLKLLVSSPYLLGIFAIITAYEVIVTVLDFNFKTTVEATFAGLHERTIYLSTYGMWVGIISLSSIVFQINKIQQWLGLGASLALLPILIAVAVISFKAFPVIGVLFWIMVLSKAINYALTQPSMKQLYIPTSKNAKYKSQAFIEMYGSRGSKALGSSVNLLRKPFIEKYGMALGFSYFVALCTYVSLGIIGVWFFITLYLGRTYKKAVDQKRIIV